MNSFAAASPLSGRGHALRAHDRRLGRQPAAQRDALEVGLLEGGTSTRTVAKDRGSRAARAKGARRTTRACRTTTTTRPATRRSTTPTSRPARGRAGRAYAGLMDRAQRSFAAAGLKVVPSYVAFGNHDGLAQGNQKATAAFEAIGTGCAKPVGGTGIGGAPGRPSCRSPPTRTGPTWARPNTRRCTKPASRPTRTASPTPTRPSSPRPTAPPATTPGARRPASASSVSTRCPRAASPARRPTATSTTRSFGGSSASSRRRARATS